MSELDEMGPPDHARRRIGLSSRPRRWGIQGNRQAEGGEAVKKLDELKRLAKEATPGPWLQATHVDEPRALVAQRHMNTSLLGLDVDGMAIVEEETDAAFIAAANPATVLALLEVVRAAKRLSQSPGAKYMDNETMGARKAVDDALAKLEALP